MNNTTRRVTQAKAIADRDTALRIRRRFAQWAAVGGVAGLGLFGLVAELTHPGNVTAAAVTSESSSSTTNAELASNAGSTDTSNADQVSQASQFTISQGTAENASVTTGGS